MNIIIGITETEANYRNYPNWIKAGDASIEVIMLTPESKDELSSCHGIVLSGGVDTHPRFYRSNNVQYPNAPSEFDEKRDQFELEVFRFATEKNIPVLAICRGMQLVNIAMGGDMVQDIEASGKNNHRKSGTVDGKHEVTVTKDSLLYEITGNEKGVVNSAHHQALGTLAKDLVVNAWSPDGLAEGVERKNRKGKSFLMGVQWHPERLGDVMPGNPFSEAIRKGFLVEVEKYRQEYGESLEGDTRRNSM